MSDASINISEASIGTPAYLDLQLSPTGDLQATGGAATIQQAVTLRLLASVEDFFLDMDAGVPWSAGLFEGRQGLTPAFEAVLQNTVLATPGILGLVSWAATLNKAARRLTIVFEAQSLAGTVAFSLPITPGGV